MSAPADDATREHRLPAALAALAWIAAGPFLLFSYGIGTSALQGTQESPRPVLALIASGLLLIATKLIEIAFLARGRAAATPRPALAVAATLALAVPVYLFVAAAPGGLSFDDSYGQAAAGTAGVWLGLSALFPLDRRAAWRFAWVACGLMLLASIGVAIWHEP